MRELTTDESQAVSKVIYNGETRELTVQYKSGRTYRYKAVPHDVFGRIAGDPSMGAALATIKRDFECEEVLPPADNSDARAASEAAVPAATTENGEGFASPEEPGPAASVQGGEVMR